MTQREKTILVLMGAAIVFGIYSLLFSDGDSTSGVRTGLKAKPADQFVSEVMQTLEKDGALEMGPFVVERAATPWRRNPMLNATEAIVAETAVEPEALPATGYQTFVYSGFIAMGSHKLAIINGFEFEIGDPVTDDGHTLRRILPNAVEIRRVGSGGTIVVKREGQE